MADENEAAVLCPKDATAMRPMGRRSGAWRCPQCRSVFLDVEAMRRGRAGRPPGWSPLVASVLASLLATMVARRLRRRPRAAGTKQAT